MYIACRHMFCSGMARKKGGVLSLILVVGMASKAHSPTIEEFPTPARELAEFSLPTLHRTHCILKLFRSTVPQLNSSE